MQKTFETLIFFLLTLFYFLFLSHFFPFFDFVSFRNSNNKASTGDRDIRSLYCKVKAKGTIEAQKLKATHSNWRFQINRRPNMLLIIATALMGLIVSVASYRLPVNPTRTPTWLSAKGYGLSARLNKSATVKAAAPAAAAVVHAAEAKKSSDAVVAAPFQAVDAKAHPAAAASGPPKKKVQKQAPGTSPGVASSESRRAKAIAKKEGLNMATIIEEPAVMQAKSTVAPIAAPPSPESPTKSAPTDKVRRYGLSARVKRPEVVQEPLAGAYTLFHSSPSTTITYHY
jgi:hypothetical protein